MTHHKNLKTSLNGKEVLIRSRPLTALLTVILLGGATWFLFSYGILSPDPGSGYLSMKSVMAGLLLFCVWIGGWVVIIGEQGKRFVADHDAFVSSTLSLWGSVKSDDVTRYPWRAIERFEVINQGSSNTMHLTYFAMLVPREGEPQTLHGSHDQVLIEGLVEHFDHWLEAQRR